MTREYVAGTRASALARRQSALVEQLLEQRAIDRGKSAPRIRERVIVTEGDVNKAERLAGRIEKGFFTRELEAALADRVIDWAVHSLKDLPVELPGGLHLAAILRRADPRDVLLARPGAVRPAGPGQLPLRSGARVGTSSLRREAQLAAFAPQAVAIPLRGNVPTRVQRLREGAHDAIILAAAGLERLGLDLSGLAAFALHPRIWHPAPGQGAIAVEARADDAEAAELLGELDDAATRSACGTEREFLRALEGGCSSPLGCYVDGDVVHLSLQRDGRWLAGAIPLPSSRPDARHVSQALAALASLDSPLPHLGPEDAFIQPF